MKIILLALAAAWPCHVSELLAQGENKPPGAVPIKNSQSPDGGKEIAIIDTSEPESASGTVQVRSRKTGELLGYFDWSGFGNHATEDSFTVLWRPDSRAFAISYEVTRGYVECKVYALEAGRCVPVQLPDFVARIAAKYHLETYSKGGEAPVKWLPGNRLVINVHNRSWGEEVHSFYHVTLRMPMHPLATIEAIRPAP